MDNAVWQEKAAGSEDSSDSERDRKRKHKDKKRKKEKKHKHSHREDASDDETATKKKDSAETSTIPSASTEALPVASEPEVLDNRPKREEWMGDSETSFLFPSVLQQDVRRSNVNAKTAAREAQQRETERLYKARELNPEIHGGQPTAEAAVNVKDSLPAASVGDGGASWLKKAYRRLEEQAADRGCSVEEVAAERFGSLAQLKNMIAAAEKREGIVTAKDETQLRRDNDDRRGFYEHRRAGRDDIRHHPSDRERDRAYPSRSHEGERLPDSASSSSHRSNTHRRSPEPVKSDDRHRDDTGRPHDRSRHREDRAASDRPRPAFVKPGEELPSSWKARDKVQYVPKSNYTPAEKQAKVEVAAEKREAVPPLEPATSTAEIDQEAPSLSPAELNQLNARILRAELMGDSATVTKLKAKIATAGKGPPNPAGPSSTRPPTESIVLSRIHEKGFSYPVKSAPDAPTRGKNPKTATHNAAGEREKFFADDDKYSLSQLVSMEKMQSADDQNALFSRLAGKVVEKVDDDYGMDDAFLKKALHKESLDRMNTRDRDRAIMEHKQIGAALGSCLYCMEGPKFPKHLVIAVGKKSLVMLPPYTPLTEGHCLICPIQHVPAATSLDEDVWEEMQAFRRALVEMFATARQECVFMEMVRDLKRHPHMTWECVPVGLDIDSDPRGCFKNAILTAEGEWTQNVKLVDLSKKDIRHAVPKNFPYFAVDFGLNGGYAHVIEDERTFPAYFGKEIVGGILEVEDRLWLRQVPMNFNDQMKFVNQFSRMWQPFDCTEKNPA